MSVLQQKGGDVATAQVKIANGQSLSAQIDLAGLVLVGIGMPAAWDAAALTFQVTLDGSTFLEMQGAAAAVSYNAAANQYVAVDPALWRGVASFKVRSGTSGAAVNQTADRLLTIVAKPVV